MICEMPQRLLIWRSSCLEAAATRLKRGDTKLEPARKQLLEDIAHAMRAGPYSVTFKKTAPPEGDLHDYFSIVRVSNPAAETMVADTRPKDSRAMQAMSKAVQALALGYALLQQPRHAAHAAALLRTWFLDEATRMKPSLQFAHCEPGNLTGNAEGLKETACLLPLLDCSQLLLGSHRWRNTEHEGLKAWFAQYAAWLGEAEPGLMAAVLPDSAGTWYDAQVAAYALFGGEEETARRIVQSVAEARLDQQLTREGSHRRERQCISYSCYNLHGLFTLARVGEAVGMNLWNYETPRGRSLRKAMQFLSPYADFGKAWAGTTAAEQPAQGQLELSPRAKLASLLAQARLAWPDAGFDEAFTKLPQDLTLPHRCRIVWAQPDSAEDPGDTSMSGYLVA